MFVLISDLSRRILFTNHEDHIVSTNQLSFVCMKNHETYVQWVSEDVFDFSKDIFHYVVDYEQNPVKKDIEDQQELQRQRDLHQIIEKKFLFMKLLFQRVSGVRKRKIPREYMQAEVYKLRYEEAINFHEGISDFEINEKFALLKDYSELTGISLRQASDEIKFKWDEYYETLRSTENLRLRYLNLLQEAVTIQDVAAVKKKFDLEVVKNFFL